MVANVSSDGLLAVGTCADLRPKHQLCRMAHDSTPCGVLKAGSHEHEVLGAAGSDYDAFGARNVPAFRLSLSR